MMLELTRRGMTIYVQYSAVLYIKKRFVKGAIIMLMGGVSCKVDQDPVTIMQAMIRALQGNNKEGSDQKKPELKIQK